MANLIPMDQAAEMLGMTVEELTTLRSNNEIFGYRDGQNWKFKMTELERVAGDLDIQLKAAGAAPIDLDDDDDIGFELSDSGDLSSSELADSAEFSLEDSAELSLEDSAELSLEDSAELIMKDSAELSLDDSEELSLEDSAELAFEESGELSLEDSAELLLEGSSDVLESNEGDDEDGLSFGSSDISLAASSLDLPAGPGDTNALLADGSNLLDEEPTISSAPSDTGKMLAAASDLAADGDEDDLFGDDLELIDDDSFEESAELSSDFEDSDLVLDDSDSSSEILLAGGESGIHLGAGESGIELDEEPLELGGSDIDSLELPEDDDDLLELDDLGDDSGAMAQEDEFKLTALEEDLDDQSSGSQVIALEDSAIYSDDGEASILGGDELSTQPAMLPASDSGIGGSIFDQAGMATGTVGAAGVAGGAMVAGAPAAIPEAPYTIWQVIGLGAVATLLAVGSMVGYDIARNLWMAEDEIISSGVLKFFLEITGMG